MAEDGARTWSLTGSPEPSAATAAHGVTVIGGRQRPRNHARAIEPRTAIGRYLTRAMRVAAAAGTAA